jgi:hypothetical protein
MMTWITKCAPWRAAARVGVLSAFALLVGGSSSDALAIPVGYICTGSCGTLGADGVVTAPPGGATYDWVSTAGGVDPGTADLNQAGIFGAEANGSILQSVLFDATAGDALEFDFNYVTSDGAGYVDYAWARLFDSVGTQVAILFTVRTAESGNTSPGFDLPANDATLTPASTPIIPGAPTWSPLGISSGDCWDAGCGFTGWIHLSYTIALSGTYSLQFGVVNWNDGAFDSGLAVAGATVDGVPIGSVPEPGVLMLFGSGLAFVLRRMRSRRPTA